MERQWTMRLPAGRRLRTTVFSHGWFDLPPFAWDQDSQTLRTAVLLEDQAIALDIGQPTATSLSVHCCYAGRWRSDRQDRITQVIERMLGLQFDLTEFYAQAGPRFAWAKAIGAGPLLTAPTIFEDLVKVLATTNCSWALTRKMVQGMVDALGTPAPNGRRAFPSAQALADQPLTFFQQTVKTGYRAPFFRSLAQLTATGALQPEAWITDDRPTPTLLKSLRELPGFGPYASELMVRLLGRFDTLAIDSWCLKKFPTVVKPVRGDVRRAIEKHYASQGCWRGLALWLDLTQDWHDPDRPLKSSDGFG